MSESVLERAVIRQVPQVLAECGSGAGGPVVAGVPARVALDPGLSYAALGVYMALVTMGDGVDPDGHQLVGRGLGVDEVAEALAELRDRGLVCRRELA